MIGFIELEQTAAPGQADVALVLTNLGECLAKAGDRHRALPYLKRALALRDGGGDRDLAAMLDRDRASDRKAECHCSRASRPLAVG